MKISIQTTIFGDTELTAFHKALSAPVCVAAPSEEEAKTFLTAQLVARAKDIAHRFVGLTAKSRGRFLQPSDAEKLDQARGILQGIRRSAPLEKSQAAIKAFLALASGLLPRPGSRFEASQAAKLDFLTEVAEFSPKALKTLGYVRG